MKYAVIELRGNQYKVSEGQELLVDKLDSNKPEISVLLLVNDDKVSIGKPYVKNAVVKIKIVEENVRGKKITVQKYKAKARYRRKTGFRPVYTRLLVEKLS